MMQTMSDNWTGYSDDMQWADFNQCYADHTWWDQSLDPSMCAYEQQGVEFEGEFEDWAGYDGTEVWGCRVPKFPPPNAPAPDVVETMAMQLHQAALENQALNPLMFPPAMMPFDMVMQSSMLATSKKALKPKAVGPPPGLLATKAVESPVGGDVPRPKPLGLASMMDFPGEIKDLPMHRSVTPATTTPATPASSLSEFDVVSTPVTPGSLPASGAAPGSDRVAHLELETSPDLGSGYSLFGSAPWQALHLSASSDQRPAIDFSLPAKVLGTPPPSGAAPAKVKLSELLSGADVGKAESDSSPTGLRPPPGLLSTGNPLPGPPPGLVLEESVLNHNITTRPPGLELFTVKELPEEDKAMENVTVEETEVNGIACTRAVWRIVQLRGRLKTSLGKPVVSPPFTITGLGDLRLMVTPDAKGTLEGMRGKSKQSHFAKMLSQGPLECTLKVKVPCTSTPVVKFYLTVGPNCRQGPFTCDFMQHTVHGCNDFDCDWLKEVDEEGCLCVGLEIVEICGGSQRPP